MLWYKTWLETRWRFLIGLALLMILAAGHVFEYPAVTKLMPVVTSVDTSGPLGRLISEAVQVQREYRGYIWWQWYRQNLTQIWTLFAVLLGSGGLLTKASGATIFTLSLPISRTRLVTTRAATSLGELFVLALVPSLLIPLLSPGIGQSYPVADALVHSLCVFAAGAVFFSLALLLSTLFPDVWRPLVIACVIAVLLASAEQVITGVSSYGIFHAMAGETYFHNRVVPWPGIVLSVAASATLLYAASVNLAHRDF
jgi:ABC-2 type transport system permease protein